MTVIAWDGRTLAVDRMSACGDTLGEVTKVVKLSNGSVACWCGHAALGKLMADLYGRGELIEKWPEFQKSDDWVRLIVGHTGGRVEFFERYPAALTVETPIYAWGIGREAALGAMEAGASAIRAVEIASKWVAGCGKGVDAFDLIDGQFVRR